MLSFGVSAGWEKLCGPVLYEGIHEHRVRAVLEVLEATGLKAGLRRHPLKGLGFYPFDHPRNGKGATGFYSLREQAVWVYHGRPAERLGQPFTPGRIPWVSYSARDDLEAMRMTLVHELGHHFYHRVPGVREAWAAAGLGGPISARALCEEERFAESFCAYFFRRGDLLTFDPGACGSIEEALETAGIDDGRQRSTR